MSLQQLKTIRKQRMERIYVELQASKEQLKYCEENVAQGKLKLEDFHQWRMEHQETLFTDLQTDCFSPNDLQNYMVKLVKFKEEEQALVEEIPRLENVLEAAKNRLSQVRRQLVDINRDLEKVNEFIEMEQEELVLAENKREENTVDELASFRAAKS
jgi:flagellar biosynthesis chaperone FliJ